VELSLVFVSMFDVDNSHFDDCTWFSSASSVDYL
jgi:hypothetical protein